MRRRLIATFSLVSLAAMTILGVALVWASNQLLQQQALLQAQHTAQAYVQGAIEGDVAPQQLVTGTIPAGTLAVLDGMLGRGTGSSLVGLRLWTDDGVLVYDSTRPTTVGPSGQQSVYGGIPNPSQFEPSSRGAGATSVPALVDEIDARGHSQRRLDVYVPIFYHQTSPTGVAEVVLSYDDTAAAVSRATRTILWLVFGGLGLLWLLQFRTVHRASRRLRSQAAENARLALLDPLTGLPNRRLFNDRLERAAALSARSGQRLGLVLLDIDRFKDVNDTLGHPRGDALLIQVAIRLTETIRGTDSVARLGGDEFAILAPVLESVQAGEALAQRVKEAFLEPFDLDGLVLHVDTSIGLAVMPDHADDVTTLMARADIAMYSAKSSGDGPTTFQETATGDGQHSSRLAMLGDLRRALANDGEIYMHYQPKIDLQSGRVVGLEALVRWTHPELGAIPPTDFIPIAEQTGLIRLVTARVLGLVAVQLSHWRRAGQELPVAVNLSARNLLEPDLDIAISALLDMHNLPAGLLELEITESAIIEDPVRARAMLDKLTAMGLAVALDDFGIGNTSISQLGTMPLSTVKIDQSFITNLGSDTSGQVLVKAIIDLAHELGLATVAEGIEDDDVAGQLRAMGCDIAQGYHWSKPLAAHEVPDMITRLEAHPPVTV
jgi:diguanylate cyclase (GGDEF)-like protein